ncbi:MAG: hypothetical protein PHW74_00305, partial [Desulfobacca sp.]|nr:hypothetical protein [Desulfobacca sp.]
VPANDEKTGTPPPVLPLTRVDRGNRVRGLGEVSHVSPAFGPPGPWIPNVPLLGLVNPRRASAPGQTQTLGENNTS